jgi:hypothetical protein
MAVKVLEDGRIADEFEMGEEPHILRDALVMSPADYEALTADEISTLKQARYDNWITLITAPQE